jgi:hypothetical protein
MYSKIQSWYENFQELNVFFVLFLVFIFINFIVLGLLYFEKIKKSARTKIVLFSFAIFLFSCLFHINSLYIGIYLMDGKDHEDSILTKNNIN